MNIRLDMIGIVAKDIAESLRFYAAIGLKTPEWDGTPYVETTLEGGIRLSWNSLDMIKEMEPEWVEPTGQRVGLAFLCENPAAVDAQHFAVVARGFKSHKDPFDAFWGQRYAQVTDPDGNIVDLFAPL